MSLCPEQRKAGEQDRSACGALETTEKSDSLTCIGKNLLAIVLRIDYGARMEVGELMGGSGSVHKQDDSMLGLDGRSGVRGGRREGILDVF